MKCINCEYLKKSERQDGRYDVFCDKYEISNTAQSESTLSELNCVENQSNFREIIKQR